MSFNPTGCAQAPLTVFGGKVSEMAPIDLPEGVTPDCSDVEFVPGSVFSRRALQKVFKTPFPKGGPLGIVPTVVYSKSYVTPTGGIQNLYIDSNGIIWMEDFTDTPGSYTEIGSITPGALVKSVTAFGREYIAPSDGLHGADVPLAWNGTWLDRVTQDGPGISPEIANLVIAATTLSGNSPISLTRALNVVTANTASAHGLKVGYQAQITNVADQPIGFISSININNETAPGIATIKTAVAHGLVPGNDVSIQNVSATLLPVLTTLNRVGGLVTVQTGSNPHGLTEGANVTIALLTGSDTNGFVGTYPVVQVVDDFTFTYAQITQTDAAGTAADYSASLNWPFTGTQSTILYEVQTCPDAFTFTVQITYSDGTWTGVSPTWDAGAVFKPWVGTFFVTSVPSATQFTYQDPGPAGTSTAEGTVTPSGQAAPGPHQMVCMFLTRNGAITVASPPVQFFANGGQYLQVSDIPIGPPNVVARIIAFTGAYSVDEFYYIPVPAMANGQQVSQATQINDNTTTIAVFDFSDPTLFSALGISIPGNNIPNQIVIDGALSFGFYASRLVTWGQRNCIQNLLGMSFDGGTCARQTVAGWTGGGTLVPGRYGRAVQSPNLTQSFFQDAYGDPIGTGLATYTARAWVTGAVIITIESSSTGFISTATLLPGGVGGWAQANFTAAMPSVIPPDMVLSVVGLGIGAIIDELSIIYAMTPYTDTVMFMSYAENPEAFDGVSGKIGASQDTAKVMAFGIIRQGMNFLTQDPGGRLHQTQDNGITEPSGWTVNELAGNCGVLSAFGLTLSQADDSSAAGGEEWMAWGSSTGVRIFGGDQPYKISQEIQPDWDAMNPQGALSIWALNDPVGRLLYFGIPVGGVGPIAPTKILTMSYRELDTAYQIATAAPIHTSFSGKLIATDHTRKWSPWQLAMNGGSLMYRNSVPGHPSKKGLSNPLSVVLWNGNGLLPGSPVGYGNVYTLNPAKYTDDDYGQIFPYYTTYFFLSQEQEQALHCQDAKGNMVPIGGGRKLLAYVFSAISGTPCQIMLTFLCNSLTNAWPLNVARNLIENPTFDLECAGGSSIAQRIAIRFASSPAPAVAPAPQGTDNSFNLQKVIACLKRAERLQVRGAVQ